MISLPRLKDFNRDSKRFEGSFLRSFSEEDLEKIRDSFKNPFLNSEILQEDNEPRII